jgi:hypothetical protein
VYEISELKLVELEHYFEYEDMGPKRARQWLAHWSPMLRSQPEFRNLYDSDDSLTEHTFTVPIATRDHVELYLTGTIDGVRPMQYLVDWKTAARPYKRWERQRWAIQPTVYYAAARWQGLIGEHGLFKYVIFEKSLKVLEPQVIEVTRGPGHVDWLTETLWTCYDLWVAHPDGPWPLNDQHALCSEKWCPFWTTCKGRFVKADFNA